MGNDWFLNEPHYPSLLLSLSRQSKRHLHMRTHKHTNSISIPVLPDDDIDQGFAVVVVLLQVAAVAAPVNNGCCRVR